MEHEIIVLQEETDKELIVLKESGTGTMSYQSKTININANGTIQVTADEGYDALAGVNINTNVKAKFPPHNEIWIYGTFTTTYNVGEKIGGYGCDAYCVAFYYDTDHYVLRTTGYKVGERFCQAFQTNSNVVLFGANYDLSNAYNYCSNATLLLQNVKFAIATNQSYRLQCAKLYVYDDLIATYQNNPTAIGSVGQLLPISEYLEQ